MLMGGDCWSRLRVQIPALHTRQCKNCTVVWKDPKLIKWGRGWPIFNIWSHWSSEFTYSSVDSFTPTILWSWVWIPSTPSMLLPIIYKFCDIFVIVLRKGQKVNKKSPSLAHFDIKKRWWHNSVCNHLFR